MPAIDHNHAKALRIVLDILSDPRRMPRKYERAPLIIALREILEEVDGNRDDDLEIKGRNVPVPP